MAAFRFRLDRLLRVRAIREEIARSELMLAERERREAEAALERSRGVLHGAESELGKVQARPVVVPREVLAGQGTLPPLVSQVTYRREQHALRLLDSERARKAWIEARVDQRALDNLRERRRVEFEFEGAKAENAQLEEWCLGRTKRRTDVDLVDESAATSEHRERAASPRSAHRKDNDR